MFVRVGEGLFLIPQWHSLEQSLLPLLQGQPLRFSVVPVEHVALQKQTWNGKRKSGISFARILTIKKRTTNDINFYPRKLTWFVTTSDAITLDLDWHNGAEAKKMWYAQVHFTNGFIVGRYARVTPRVTSHMRNTSTLSLREMEDTQSMNRFCLTETKNHVRSIFNQMNYKCRSLSNCGTNKTLLPVSFGCWGTIYEILQYYIYMMTETLH